MSSTSILQFADVHFGVEDADALAKLSATIERLEPDVSVICGDITQTGSVEEFEAAARWIEALPGPKVICAGNHDTPMFGLLHRLFDPFGRYRRYIAPLGESIYEDDHVLIQPLNTSRGVQASFDWSTGVVNMADLDRRIARFQASDADKLRLISVHHPMIYPPYVPLQKTTKRGPAALKHLADQNCDAVLSGHVHIPFVEERTPGGSELLSIGAGTLSTRRRGQAASFNHIRIDAEALTISAIEFKDDDFLSVEKYRKKRAELSGWRRQRSAQRREAA